MAFRKFVDAALDGRAFAMYGDGRQTRDFTYVADAVRANLLATAAPGVGDVFNVGGGERISLADALARLTALLTPLPGGRAPEIERHPAARGDVHDTFADRAHVERAIGYRPTVPFDEGLARLVAWARDRRVARG
jgi:nucleoside-diphosphate-sugar epimerase